MNQENIDKMRKIMISQTKMATTNYEVWMAVARDDLELCQSLVQTKEDANTRDGIKSVLVLALANKNYDIADLLISKGADVNFNHRGTTVSEMAAIQVTNEEELVILNNWLKKQGVDMMKKSSLDNGESAYQIAQKSIVKSKIFKSKKISI